MKNIIYTLLLIFLLGGSLVTAQSIDDSHFRECHVTGSFTLYDAVKDQWITSDPADQYLGTLPASTFKIVNSLIALQEGAVKDEEEVFPWPGEPDTLRYGKRPDIYHDMNMVEAYRKSAVWFYLEISRKIGREKYADYLANLDYGNQDISVNGPDFWNFGNLTVSPRDQINLLVKLHHEELPFTKGVMHRVKNIMLERQSYEYVLRSKTGWTSQDGEDIGWYVGYLVTDGGEYYFATRIRKPVQEDNEDFAECRREITMQILRDLKFIY